MTGADRPALRVVGGGAEDSVTRRQRFEQAHPEAVILPPCAGRWRAVVPAGLIPGDGTRTTLGAWDLGSLMDQLDAIYPPDGRRHGCDTLEAECGGVLVARRLAKRTPRRRHLRLNVTPDQLAAIMRHHTEEN